MFNFSHLISNKILLFHFFKFIYFMYVSALLTLCQKRASDSSINGCELSCGCWDLNSEPQEEYPVLLTTEPSL